MSANQPTQTSLPPSLRAPGGHPGKEAAARWGIVLAGGDGARMRPMVSRWLGEDRPKQYCTFTGSRSMLQHTLDRAASVVPGERIVTIIGRGHRKFMAGDGHACGPVLEQPDNLGTAPGVFLPAAYVLAEDPEATVILLPADHYAHPEERFCDHILLAFELAEACHDRIILVGAVPDRAETEYGWVNPGKMRTDAPPPPAHGLRQVMGFREKPGGREARALLRGGCLWNTMVIAAKARTLWSMGRQCLPGMMCEFDAFLSVLRAVRAGRLDPALEAGALAGIYGNMAPADFSRDILQHVSGQSLVLPMEGVDWCDWGSPRRVVETLARRKQRPLFPPDCLGREPATMANEKHCG